MGLDAIICFRSKAAEPILEEELLPGFTIKPADEYVAEDIPEATHEVDCGCCRYYGEQYERGPWPLLASVLMSLLASEDVETVWYGSDCNTPQQIGAEEVNAISLHYMLNGNRPYVLRRS